MEQFASGTETMEFIFKISIVNVEKFIMTLILKLY